MTRKNVLPAAILVATALVISTVLVPNSIGVASANPCSTNGGGTGGISGGSGGDGGDSGSIGECTIDISDSGTL